FACDHEFLLFIAFDIGPGGGGDHADVGDIGVFCFRDVREVAFAIVYEQEAAGGGAVFAGLASAANEEVGESVVVEIAGDGDGGVHAIVVHGEGGGVEG